MDIEIYRNDDKEVLNFVSYRRTGEDGVDFVLQHKIHGVEMGHITLHPDGAIHVKGRNTTYVTRAINNGFAGFRPQVSVGLKDFANIVKGSL